MLLGLFLKGMNEIRGGHYLDFLFECVPQTLMLLALFGYMDTLIVTKWLTNYEQTGEEPPSIISTMINMILGFGQLKD